MTKTKPQKKLTSPPKKVVLKRTDIEIKEAKINELISSFSACSSPPLTFWKDETLGLGDIMGIIPVKRTTKRTIGGQFNPYEDIKEEEFVKFYIIDISLANINSEKENIHKEQKKKFIENKGMLYLNNFDIGVIFEYVVNNA